MGVKHLLISGMCAMILAIVVGTNDPVPNLTLVTCTCIRLSHSFLCSYVVVATEVLGNLAKC